MGPKNIKMRRKKGPQNPEKEKVGPQNSKIRRKKGPQIPGKEKVGPDIKTKRQINL